MTEAAPFAEKPPWAPWVVSEPVYEADTLNQELAVSPWQGHRDFAYDLITFVRPRMIVELGVHYGCSYFAFCQAVKDRAIEAQVVGIDTWKGDPHAGHYGEEVFDLVQKTRASYFSDDRFRLRRASFEDAVGEFSEESIDLLHIDGLHTYDAVSRDFATWLPKLARDGIMLLHDVAPSSGYESARFWAETREQFPHFEFLNRWGLGIVFPKGDRWFRAGLAQGLPDKIRGYLYRGEWLAGAVRASKDLQWQKEQTDRWWLESERLKLRVAELEKWRRIASIGAIGIVRRATRD